MGRLIYSSIGSLDGYTVDAAGSFDWAAPDAQVHAFVNDLARPVGTYLFGRKMYEVMRYWDSAPTLAVAGAAVPEAGRPDPRLNNEDLAENLRESVDGMEAAGLDYATIWQAADKVVYSESLPAVDTARTRLERTFDPSVVREFVAAAPADVGIGGPTLAAAAIRAGLVDVYELFLVPVVVGGGTRALPDDVRLDLELIDERRFDNGTVYLGYRSIG